MRLLLPIPRPVARLFSLLILIAWALQMGSLVRVAYSRSGALAGDLARYGSAAHWKGIYYRGAKIGFSVSETVAVDGGYELHEEAQLRMSGLGSSSAAQIKTMARVDSNFTLRSFTFSLDPGTGPITLDGTVEGRRLTLGIASASGRRTEVRELAEPPSLSLNLPRRLAAQGLEPGKKFEVMVFDPATMRNAPMTVEVQARDVVRSAGRPIPAFRLETRFSGITSISWITDVGEIVREESPTGFMVVGETRGRATALAVPGDVQTDLLGAVAIKPTMKKPIVDPRGVERLRLRVQGIDLDPSEADGVGQRRLADNELELYVSTEDEPAAIDPSLSRYLGPEPLLESDAPEIRAEAEKAVAGVTGTRDRAERLTRYVNSLLEKKPTISIPSALEVLRTKVGDCNEHTALYVAMARALGLPARIAVGLVYLHGAFYYHAWPEVYIEEPAGRGQWLAVDPTLNEFPADATHLRLARGGLDRQTAILPIIGRGKITVVDMKLYPDASPVLVGIDPAGAPNFAVPLPRRDGSGQSCWSRPGF